MKSTELRIGNYVEFEYKIAEVYQVSKGGCIKVETEEYGIESYEESYIQCIPITEEWLLKFGFRGDDYNGDITYFYAKSGIQLNNSQIYRSDQGYFLNNPNEVKRHYIKYVHQLQNLYFALTGEELTIKQQENGI